MDNLKVPLEAMRVNHDVVKIRRNWFKILNANRIGKCSLNDLLMEEDGITPIAGYCNCGCYHIVLGNKVEWDPRAAIVESKNNLTLSKVRTKIKELYIMEL